MVQGHRHRRAHRSAAGWRDGHDQSGRARRSGKAGGPALMIRPIRGGPEGPPLRSS